MHVMSPRHALLHDGEEGLEIVLADGVAAVGHNVRPRLPHPQPGRGLDGLVDLAQALEEILRGRWSGALLSVRRGYPRQRSL